MTLPKLSKGWEKKNRGQSAGNPAWEMAWTPLSKKLEVDNSKVTDITTRGNNALILDLGKKYLGRIFIQ